MNKFRKGQRVVPKSWKTGDYGATLDRSKAWNDAQEKEQPYLWVQHICGDFHIECSVDKFGEEGVDFFYKADLEPYKA